MSDYNLEDLSVDQAALALSHGEVVAFPTETVYGLGADAENSQAVAQIYNLKQRPSNHPLIVHLAPEAELSYWVADLPNEAKALISAFWPGPLTLILKKSTHISGAATGGQDTIGLRCPSHPTAQHLLTAFARFKKNPSAGIAAPSANKFGQISPTQSSHVLHEFQEEFKQGQLGLVKGDQSEVGIESTIVDLSGIAKGRQATLLRPGHITRTQLKQVLGYSPLAPDELAPRASGTLKAHYAPRTPLFWLPVLSAELESLLNNKPAHEKWVLFAHNPDSLSHTEQVDVFEAPSDPVNYAHALYLSLRRLDRLAYDRILVQRLPQEASWEAVNDRLERAVATFESL